MHHYQFSFQAETYTREQRLCFGILRSPDPSPGPINSAVNTVTNAIKLKTDRIAQRKEMELRHKNEIEWINALTHPDFLTAPKDDTPLSATHGPEERMKHLTIDQRKLEMKGFLKAAFPASVRTSVDFRSHFDDLFQPDNLKVVQQALKLLVGEKGTLSEADTAWKLAKMTIYERNPGSVAGGRLITQYLHWVEDNKLKQSDPDATNSAHIYATSKNGELKGAALLGLLDQPGVMAGMKLVLREKDLEDHQAMEISQTKRNKMTGRAELDKLAQESQTFMDNFRNLDPRMQFGLIAAGGVAAAMLLKSKNWFAKAIPISLLGAWSYLTLFKGDTEAVDHIAAGIQQFTTFSFGKVRTGAEKVGILAPKKKEIDKLTVMSNFLKSKAKQDIEPTAAAFSALSNAKIGVMANAFTFDESAGELTGELQISKDMRNPAGKILYEHLKTITQDLGGAGREQMFNELKTNKKAVGSAILHVMYTIGSGIEDNIATASHLDTFVENGGNRASYESLSAEQKAQYLHIAYEGLNEARKNPIYKDMTFVELITEFQKAALARTVPRLDGAEKVTDIKAEKPEEFRAMDAVRTARTKPELDALLSDTGAIALDYTAFLGRCEAELKLEPGAKALLLTQFNDIRKSGESLPAILQTVEKFKYAILLSILRDTPPTTSADIEMMIGSRATFTLSTALDNLTSFINRNIVTVASNFNVNVVDIQSVKALLTERTGTASLNSLNGAGLPKLQQKMDVYDVRFKELRDTKTQARKIVDSSPIILGLFAGDAAKARAQVQTSLEQLGYTERIARMEQYFAQKCTNSLALSMLVTQKAGTANDILDAKNNRSTTSIEEDNLAREFDVYFDDICKQTISPNMWESGEQLAAAFQPFVTSVEIDSLDFEDESNRMKAVNHVRDLALASLLNPTLVPDLKAKINSTAYQMYTTWDALGNNEAERLRNNQSYSQGIALLIPLMELLSIDATDMKEMRDWENPDGPAYALEIVRMTALQQTLNAHKNATNDIVVDLGIDPIQPLLEGRKYEVAVTLVPTLITGSPPIAPPPAPKTFPTKTLTVPAGSTTFRNLVALTNAEIALERSTLNPSYRYDTAKVTLTITKPGLATRSADHTIPIN
ncbi:MAG: hypothetical protein KBD00_01945 [Candidatus Peribacteraceae bacterium]|nr:hypothetical protein [Candidatus Peribacteraceae bacterium]